MAATVNLLAGEIGVALLQAGTPESLEAVADKWLDTHLETEVLSMDLQVGERSGGSILLLIVYRKNRRQGRA